MRIVESNDVGFLSFGFPFKLTWAYMIMIYMGQSGQIMSLLHCGHGQIGQVAACGGQIPTIDWCESIPVCLTSVLCTRSFVTKMLTARWPRSRCKAGCTAVTAKVRESNVSNRLAVFASHGWSMMDQVDVADEVVRNVKAT